MYVVVQGPQNHAAFVLLVNTRQEKVIAIQDERRRQGEKEDWRKRRGIGGWRRNREKEKEWEKQ
jgi:hypothetical protein